MAKLTRKSPKRKGVVRRTYAKLEDRMMAAAGRRAVKTAARRAKAISRKAMKAALLAASLAAAKVVLDEVREQRRRG